MKFCTKISTKVNRSNKTKTKTIIFLLILLIAMAIISIAFGSAKLSFKSIYLALLNKNSADSVYKIIIFVRIPRTIAALAAGAALATSGAILQSVLNNALASPNIIGINSGSGLFVVLLTAFFPSYIAFAPAAAFLGALLAAMFIYLIAYKTGAARITIILAGIAVSSFFSAIIDAVFTLDPDIMLSANSFMVGGFSSVRSDVVFYSLIYIAIGLFVAVFLSNEMNVLALGDDIASSLGMRINVMRLILISTAALLAGSAVSFSGLLGFVGLIIPHICRSIIGADNKYLIPASAVLGAFFVLFCDF
ncbi:MAG: iron ABC transporter permease, partial [Eubacteriaceae bacterium]|nr:iron ABC transporter permease [Eubacteriaceae bacterium]